MTSAIAALTPERLREIFRVMLTERRLAEQHGKWHRQYGFVTTGARLGAEAIPAGVCYALRRRADVGPEDPVDLVVGVYGRLHMGCTLKGIFAEMLGKTSGYTRGRGGNNHFISVYHGIMGCGGIVGSLIPQAVGMGWAAKQNQTGQVVACFFGEGASSTGMFHEGLNLASIYKVPVVFVCANNGYAISTPASQTISIDRIAKRAAAYSMPGETVDGTDAVAIFDAVSRAAERARAGDGPSLIECKFWRWSGYGPDDDQSYRSQDELDFIRENDPVKKFQRYLEERGVLAAGESEQIDAAVKAEIDEALEWAISQTDPSEDSIYDYVFPES